MSKITESQKKMAFELVESMDKFQKQAELKRIKNYSGKYWEEVRKLCKG